MERATTATRGMLGVLLALCLALGLLAVAPAFDKGAQAQAMTALAAASTLDKGAQAQAMTAQQYWTKTDEFLADSRHKHGVTWNQSNTSVFSTLKGYYGCWAYGNDFAKYVYGIDDYRNGSAFYSASDIRTGDVIRINNSHTFVVIERNGSSLRTAEGGFGKHPNQTVRVATGVYSVSGGALYDSYNGKQTITVGYHFDTGGATIRGGSWWTGETIQNLGDDFYGNLILRTNWVAATVDPNTDYIVNADTSKTGRDPDHWATFWHFVRNSDGSYRILNSYYDNRPLQASGTTSGSRIILGSSYTGANNQKWFVYHASGQYIMRSAASDFVVNVDNASADPGAKWQVWTYTDYATERLSVYKHDPAQASTFSVKAGTSSDPTVVSWNKPASGLTAWYNVRIGTLDADGNIITPYYNTDYIDNAATSQEVQLPAGKYRAWVQTCSYFNYKPSNTVDFTVGAGDTEPPTLTNVKVAEITDEYVKITAQAEDNVGIVKSVTVGDPNTGAAVYGGVRLLSYIEVGEPGSGDYRQWWGVPLYTHNLGDTPQKSIALELMLYTPKGAKAANLVNGAQDYLWPGHHRVDLCVRDTSLNASEIVSLEFDVPVATDGSDTITLAVGETKTLEDIFGSDVGTRPNIYDGGQGIVEVSKAAAPYTFTGKSVGSCVIMAGNNNDAAVSVKRIVVTEGGSADDAAVQQVMAAIDAVNALPAADAVTLNDKAAIQDARAQYDAVVNDEDLFALMSSVSYRDTSAKLTAVEQALAALEAAAEEEAAAQAERDAQRAAAEAAIAAVSALPAADAVTLDDADAVHAAQDALDALTDEQIEYVKASDWRAATAKLEAVLAKLHELEAAAAEAQADQAAVTYACGLVEALPAADALTLDDADAVAEADAAFDTLTDAQIDLIAVTKYRQLSQTLQAAKDKIAELQAAAGGEDDEQQKKDQAAADDACALVEALSAVDALTLADADAVNAADAAFSGLTDAQVDLIPASKYTQYSQKLRDAKAKLQELKDAADAQVADQRAAAEACALVEDLPAPENVTVGDADAIRAAKEAFNGLTEAQLDLIESATYNRLQDKLDAAVKALEALQKDQEAADAAVAKVQALPAAEAVTLADADAIRAAQAAFEGLTDVQQACLKNSVKRTVKQKLADVVAALEALEATQGDDPTPVDPTPVDPTPADPTPVDPTPQPVVKKDISAVAMSLSANTATYAGKAVTPKVNVKGLVQGTDFTVAYTGNNAIGAAKATVTGKGTYKGSKSLAFTINPAKAAISKAKAAKKKLTVQWKAVTGGVQYQVSYKLKSAKKWTTKTAKKTSLTLKKLKSKKQYQVKVRAFKKVGGKTYYGAWSASKTVKVK